MKEFANMIENQSMTAYFYTLLALFVGVSVLTGNLNGKMLIVQVFIAFCFTMVRGVDKLLEKTGVRNE